MLFSNQRKHQVNIPFSNSSNEAPNVSFLVDYLCENLMRDSRKELFVLDGEV
jgi:ubiquitin related modifier 1